MTKHTATEEMESDRIEESTPPPPPTLMFCPTCHVPWSADYHDYSWMRESDLLFCSCGEVLCAVGELKIDY